MRDEWGSTNTRRTETVVSAYLIFQRDKTLDEHELTIYSKNVPPTLTGHEVKLLALYGAYEDLEGAPTEGTVILEFPSIEAAKAWYDGPMYRKVREHRFKGAEYRVTLVEGCEASFDLYRKSAPS
jgi:uncharacterized protein (DUF1330 family)